MREVVFQPKVWIRLPKEVKVKSWRVDGDNLEIDFTIPGIFEGKIEAEIFWKKNKAFVEHMDISGHYLYESNKSFWNDFLFEGVKDWKAEEIWRKILSGELLLEEMERRKEAPEDEFPEFLDSYGPEVVADIANAINQLFPGLLQTQTG